MAYGTPKKIFVVDDDPMMLTMIQDYLTKDIPHQIQLFATGEECLKNMIQNPDVIILDYNLNTVKSDAINGMDVLQQIRKNYPGVHVIMLSNQEKYSVALQAVQKGAVQYVMKDEQAFEKISAMISEIK